MRPRGAFTAHVCGFAPSGRPYTGKRAPLQPTPIEAEGCRVGDAPRCVLFPTTVNTPRPERARRPAAPPAANRLRRRRLRARDAPRKAGRRARPTVVTWLILPVVICLSQRLSDACLSITFILGNCEWLIKSVIVYLMVLYSDNRRNSRANTCVRPDFWKGCIY